jgi:hypothetical protein
VFEVAGNNTNLGNGRTRHVVSESKQVTEQQKTNEIGYTRLTIGGLKKTSQSNQIQDMSCNSNIIGVSEKVTKSNKTKETIQNAKNKRCSQCAVINIRGTTSKKKNMLNGR